MKTAETSSFRLGLVSMPWSIFNRPSIQLAALKAYLDQNSPYTTDLFHPYLAVAASIGGRHYHYLAQRSWAGEALYAPLLFPEQRDAAKKLFYEECSKEPALKNLNFQDCLKTLQQNLERWTESLDLSTYKLFGFSLCFNQLLASLSAAKMIKKLRPELPIVIGGSGCVGEIGYSLVQNFPQIDYVVNGEGEEALLQLCDSINSATDDTSLPATIFSKKRLPDLSCNKGISDLNTLPIPDYAPYFQEMQQHFSANTFIPVLPLEFSRGCWWNKCKFCNLNLQWHGYRWKSAATVVTEVEQQARQHKCLDFCFTDNALPPKETDTFFRHLAASTADYDFFAELRVITTPDTMPLYRQGGLTAIQVGIESLSTSLLKKMDKGSRCIDNIAAMRQSAEARITLDGNLICEFPGSSEQEVQETLANLDFVLPYSPLSSAVFFLGHGSPVAKNPEAFGITAVIQHKKNKKLFPPAQLDKLTMLLKSYRGDRSKQQTLWKPVHKKIQQWQNFHKERDNTQPALSYRDGGNFLLIRQELVTGSSLHHRLQNTSRKIYLFCRSIRSINEICTQFPQIKKADLLQFLNGLVNKKLIFAEKDLFLALAINASR